MRILLGSYGDLLSPTLRRTTLNFLLGEILLGEIYSVGSGNSFWTHWVYFLSLCWFFSLSLKVSSIQIYERGKHNFNSTITMCPEFRNLWKLWDYMGAQKVRNVGLTYFLVEFSFRSMLVLFENIFSKYLSSISFTNEVPVGTPQCP